MFYLTVGIPCVNPLPPCLLRPSGLKYEKAKEWRIPCVNAQWLCDILLGNFEALRQIQHSRYSNFNLQEPLIPNQHLVQNLLGTGFRSLTVGARGLEMEGFVKLDSHLLNIGVNIITFSPFGLNFRCLAGSCEGFA
jgi:hypothetical protein